MEGGAVIAALYLLLLANALLFWSEADERFRNGTRMAVAVFALFAVAQLFGIVLVMVLAS